MAEGWRRENGILKINPTRYVEDLLDGFTARGPIWRIPKMRPKEVALVQKYRFLADWLDVPKGDAIRSRLNTLAKAKDGTERAKIEGDLQVRIEKRSQLG